MPFPGTALFRWKVKWNTYYFYLPFSPIHLHAMGRHWMVMTEYSELPVNFDIVNKSLDILLNIFSPSVNYQLFHFYGPQFSQISQFYYCSKLSNQRTYQQASHQNFVSLLAAFISPRTFATSKCLSVLQKDC